MRLARLVVAGAVLARTLPVLAQPVPAPPGAVACGGCHAGQNSGGIPSLAGLKSAEISAAMLDYKADRRAPTIMNRIAKGFSESEIKDIAEWLETHR